ncbi:hypothetical protein BH09ACT10_BH09ACT10_10330 [soil metagenome]
MSTRGLRMPTRREPAATDTPIAAESKRRPPAKKKARLPTALPSVNLLSPWAFERIAVRRLRTRFIVGCLVLVLAAAAAWGIQSTRVADAESLLKVEDAETSRLSQKNNDLQPVKAYIAGVDLQKVAISGAMSTEIYFSNVLKSMKDSAPDGVALDSLVVLLAPPTPTAAPAPAAGSDGNAEGDQTTPAPAVPVTPSLCPGPDPFQTRRVVACITLSGSASNRAEVGAFVVALGANDSFVEPFISTTTTSDASRVTFSGSVGLSEKVFSGRYAKLDTWLVGKSS